MLCFHGELRRLTLFELIPLPQLLEQVEAEIPAQRLLDDLTIALARPGGPHFHPTQELLVDRKRRPHLCHKRIISSVCARIIGRHPGRGRASARTAKIEFPGALGPGGEAAATDSDPRSTDEADPPSPAATFVTTEHFVLQGARAATIAESNGRANMFLAAVSGGLVALGLVATASSLGAAFYGFGLVLLPTLAFVGLVTFERALQSSIEDTEYARRIALLRAYYFEQAPEIAPYLVKVPPAERLFTQPVPGDRWQGYRTVAGMVAVITAVLAGSTAALVAILIFDHSLAAAVISGVLVALPAMIAMIRYQDSAWDRAAVEPLTPGEG
jgi:hypothetical protein